METARVRQDVVIARDGGAVLDCEERLHPHDLVHGFRDHGVEVWTMETEFFDDTSQTVLRCLDDKIDGEMIRSNFGKHRRD